MSNAFLRNLVEEIKDEDTSIMADGEAAAEYSGFIDTGCYILNAVLSGSLYGGVPNNKIIGFAGEQATGKTFFALGLVKNFLDNNPEAGVVYYDTESSVTKEMLEERGIDTQRVIVSEPDTIQKFRTHALRMIDLYSKQKNAPPMMFVLDSLGMLSTSKEMEDTEAGKDTRDMTRAQLIRGAFRVLTLKLARVKIPLIVTNHVYEAVGSYVPMKEIGGGSGLKYAASQIAMLTKSKDRDGTEVVGGLIGVSMYKSRITKENTKVKVRLSYKHGLDRYYGLLELGEKYGVFKKVSTRYELPDGTKVFGKSILNDPEKYFTDDVMAELEEAAKKEFKYGSSGPDFEESTATEEDE